MKNPCVRFHSFWFFFLVYFPSLLEQFQSFVHSDSWIHGFICLLLGCMDSCYRKLKIHGLSVKHACMRVHNAYYTNLIETLDVVDAECWMLKFLLFGQWKMVTYAQNIMFYIEYISFTSGYKCNVNSRFKSKTNIQLILSLSISLSKLLYMYVQACSDFQDPSFKSAYSIMSPFGSLCSRMCLLTVQKCVVVISNAFYKCNLDLLILGRLFSLVTRWALMHEIVDTSCPCMPRFSYMYAVPLHQ